jgi:hypothetical protein
MFGRKDAVLRFIETFRPLLAEQGSVVAGWRHGGGKKSGPYYRLTCRDAGGKQRSAYLGCDSDLVAQIRRILAALQKRRQQARELGRAGPALRRALRASRRDLDEELAVVGLSRIGSEIRGWKNLAPAIQPALHLSPPPVDPAQVLEN